MSDLKSFYEELDKPSEKFVPEDGKYVGHLAIKDKAPYVEVNEQYRSIDFALTFDEGEYKGRWAFGRLNVQELSTVNEEDIENAKTAYGIAHRTVKALTGGKESKGGLADKEGWKTKDLLDYVSAVISTTNGKKLSFSTKRRVKNGAPVLDKNGDQRYSVYINGVIE